MDSFVWNSCFITGLTDVDEQHHRLVDLINRFGDLLMRPQGAAAAELDPVFVELAHYAQYHFAEEEALMSRMRLDERHIAHHRSAHNGFLEEVMQLHGGLRAGDSESGRSLLQFLTHWLAYHILGADQEMARQMTAIRGGSRPEDAFHKDPDSPDPATDTLLKSLNKLFQQVSERNRALEQLNRTLEARVEERTHALLEANQRLEDLANTDPLTGLPNRRFVMGRFAEEWAAAVRNDTPLSCLMIDADGFKVINDNHGHDAGDGVLRALARQLRHAVRTDDLVSRLGGDEFLVICAQTPLDGAVKVGEAIRSEVAALRVAAGTGEWHGSVSVGVAARTSDMSGLEDLLTAADFAVYEAKRNGRNCVAAARQPG